MSDDGERRGRGRPKGRTPAGEQARDRLYTVALEQLALHGYEATTLREIARVAGVSPGLLYRYFPSKAAVVLAFYDELSSSYAERAQSMAAGPWGERATFALRTSLGTLRPHRRTLQALIPVLLGEGEGVLAERTASSRRRVQPVFVAAVTAASDAPPEPAALALGRLLYLLHLAVLLWWLMDRSPEQRATDGLLALLERLVPLAALVLRLPGVPELLLTADGLARDALLGED